MEHLAHISRMRGKIHNGPIAATLLCLVLAHGLIATSLLVECIPADGRSLIELLGQDPCHNPFGAVEVPGNGQNAATSAIEDDTTDPCVDLGLEGFGVSPGVLKIHPPAASATESTAEGSPLSGMTRVTPVSRTLFKRARGPGTPAGCESPLAPSLRI